MKHDGHIVSVIIPTLGRDTLNFCLAALEKQTRLPDEIIVIVDRDRRGTAWARNEGIRQARGELIAFTDDDCMPPENWLERLIEAIEDHNAAGAGGNFQETDSLLHEIGHRYPPPKNQQVDTTGLVGNTGNVMYKRVWLDTCTERDGYIFNEVFKGFASEDWELAWRLRRRGAKLIFVPNKVTHLRQSKMLVHLRHQFNRGIGIALLFKLQRISETDLTAQKSLIWGQGNSMTGAKWFKAFWHKAIGPFDVDNFQCLSRFWLFWLGEKFQGLGFLWGLFRHGFLIQRISVEQPALWAGRGNHEN